MQTWSSTCSRTFLTGLKPCIVKMGPSTCCESLSSAQTEMESRCAKRSTLLLDVMSKGPQRASKRPPSLVTLKRGIRVGTNLKFRMLICFQDGRK